MRSPGPSPRMAQTRPATHRHATHTMPSMKHTRYIQGGWVGDEQPLHCCSVRAAAHVQACNQFNSKGGGTPLPPHNTSLIRRSVTAH